MGNSLSRAFGAAAGPAAGVAAGIAAAAIAGINSATSDPNAKTQPTASPTANTEPSLLNQLGLKKIPPNTFSTAGAVVPSGTGNSATAEEKLGNANIALEGAKGQLNSIQTACKQALSALNLDTEGGIAFVYPNAFKEDPVFTIAAGLAGNLLPDAEGVATFLQTIQEIKNPAERQAAFEKLILKKADDYQRAVSLKQEPPETHPAVLEMAKHLKNGGTGQEFISALAAGAQGRENNLMPEIAAQRIPEVEKYIEKIKNCIEEEKKFIKPENKPPEIDSFDIETVSAGLKGFLIAKIDSNTPAPKPLSTLAAAATANEFGPEQYSPYQQQRPGGPGFGNTRAA